MKTNIVIPVKNPSSAKQRLAEALTATQREELALVLFDHLLSTLFPADGYHVLIVTDSAKIESLAALRGAEVLRESQSRGETAAVEEATRWSVRNGFDRQLVIPGDMPCVTRDDIRFLLGQPMTPPEVILTPAVGDDGTNAILSAPPDVLTFRFGARSFPDYVEQMRRKNVRCRIVRMENMVLDLDTPEDLSAFLALDRDLPARRLILGWNLDKQSIAR